MSESSNQLAGPEFDPPALQAVATAVEQGSGLPELVRTLARLLNASLALFDRTGSVLAVAAKSSSEESSLVAGGTGVTAVDLKAGGVQVGVLRVRTNIDLSHGLFSVLVALLASELERVHAPERVSKQATTDFLRALLARELSSAQVKEFADQLGLKLREGVGMVIARAHPLAPTAEDWRPRMLSLAERGARTAVPGTIAALLERPYVGNSEAVLMVPGSESTVLERAANALLRELDEHLAGFTFAVGLSRVAGEESDLSRAADEARLAANVAEASGERLLAFEQTGAYRLLLPAMSDTPAELERFYAETVESIVAYDEQYETELIQTLETFLDSDGNVAGTAQKLYTHRHTVRYRLERIRELTGLDVGSTDGREKLSLGLKSMRVLGIPTRRGPASESEPSR